MKKFIMTAIAAGTLAVGTAASAQDLGTVIGSLFGFGQPTYSYGTPAVVAGTQQVYTDTYGRQFYYDQYGRQVYVNNGVVQQQQIVGYDSYGRPIYGTPSYSYGGTYGNGSYAYGGQYRRWDRDGDGVANSRDRWPDDPRYN